MSTVLHVSRQTARKVPQGGNNSTYMANDSQYVRAIQTKQKKVLRYSDATGVLCSTPNKAD